MTCCYIFKSIGQISDSEETQAWLWKSARVLSKSLWNSPQDPPEKTQETARLVTLFLSDSLPPPTHRLPPRVVLESVSSRFWLENDLKTTEKPLEIAARGGGEGSVVGAHESREGRL